MFSETKNTCTHLSCNRSMMHDTYIYIHIYVYVYVFIYLYVYSCNKATNIIIIGKGSDPSRLSHMRLDILGIGLLISTCTQLPFFCTCYRFTCVMGVTSLPISILKVPIFNPNNALSTKNITSNIL
jgi:hypothetical protein